MRQTMRGCRIICRIGTSLFEAVVSSVVVVTVVVVSDSVVVVVASSVVTSGAEEQPLNTRSKEPVMTADITFFIIFKG